MKARKSSVKLHRPMPSDHPLSEPVEWLGEIGRSKWLEVVADNPHLQKTDGDFLAAYCDAFDEFHAARAVLAGLCDEYCLGTNGSMYPHPAIARKNKATERIRKFAKDLGIAKPSRKTQPKLMPSKIKPA